MIHVYVRGRLGNQLFQYAFVRMLQFHNPEQRAVYHFEEVYSAGGQDQDFVNALKAFHVVGVDETNEQPHLSLAQRLLLRVYFFRYPHTAPIHVRTQYQMRWVKIMNSLGLYYLDLGYFPFDKKIKGDVIVSGNFESEKYFKEISSQILHEIVPIARISENNQQMVSKMMSTQSVCLSIRRGDFVENPDVENLHHVCSKAYYLRAVDYIRRHVSNPVLFIFSNDIAWVRQNLDFELETFYESGADPSWEILELMSNCKHFIISNSTFNWWAQYRGSYDHKIVVAPERWFNSPFVPDIFLDNWVKLSVD